MAATEAVVLLFGAGAIALVAIGVGCVLRCLGSTRPAITTAWLVGPALALAGTGAALVAMATLFRHSVWAWVFLASGVILTLVRVIAGQPTVMLLRLPRLDRADGVAITAALAGVAAYLGTALASADTAALASVAVDLAPAILIERASAVVPAASHPSTTILLSLLAALMVTPFLYWIARASGLATGPAVLFLGAVLWLYAQPGALAPGPLDGRATWSLMSDVLVLMALFVVSLSIDVGAWWPRAAAASLLALASAIGPTNALATGPAVAVVLLLRGHQQQRLAAAARGVGLIVVALIPVLEWEHRMVRVLDHPIWLLTLVAGVAAVMLVAIRRRGWLSQDGAAPVALVISVLACEAATVNGSEAGRAAALPLLGLGTVVLFTAATVAVWDRWRHPLPASRRSSL